MTTYTPDLPARRPHGGWPLMVVVGMVALLSAGVAGYAIAGGFTNGSAPGQEVSDQVLKAWATGDAAAIAATFDPAVKVLLIYDNTQDGGVGTKELTAAIQGAIGIGNTYKQIGPVSTYEAEDGDLYVGTTVEVKGPGHPVGDPLVGFYRVHDGKVVRMILLDAEHY